MKAVILAGGLGSRLKPFTDVIPKPLLPLGEKSLLEVQIERLRACGFNEICLAVNYRAEYIQSYLGNGERLGVTITYSVESKPLGTCGPVSLLADRLNEPFILLNGDILTKADFADIHAFAMSAADTDLTIVTKVITTPFRFGNVHTDGIYVTSVEEKPDLHFEILAGIYVLKPPLFDLIPRDTFFGIDDLIHLMLKRSAPISRYLLKEYWIDIGQVEDYQKARDVYRTHFQPNDSP